MNARNAFRSIALISCALASEAVIAQVNTNSEAYKTGHSAGKFVGYLIFSLVALAIINKFFKK